MPIFWVSITYGQSITSNAGSAASQAPGNRAWSNTGNATGNVDGTVSSAGILNPGNPDTQQLLLTNFNFSTLPASISITGISATVTRSSSTPNAVSDLAIELVKGGIVQTADNKANATTWPSTLTAVTYGSSSDLWNNTWTRADVVSSNFGAIISGTRNGSNTTARVDAVSITVYYTVTSPILLSLFDVRINSSQLPEVTFTTELEEGVKEFTIQRSSDGRQFSDLISIRPKNNSGSQTRYLAIDERPLKGRNFYRLKETDIDGLQFFFNIKSIELSGTSQSARLFYTHGTLNIENCTPSGVYKYEIFDISGREVEKGHFFIQSALQTAQISIGTLRTGIYLVKVYGQSNFRLSKKIYIGI